MEEKIKKVLEIFKDVTAKQCYKIVVEEGKPRLLDNKIGGMPYLPVGEEYPKAEDGKPLGLLLQVNLESVELKGYPQNGILEIYMDSQLDYPSNYKVLYFKPGLEYRTDLPQVDTQNFVVKEALKIKLEKAIEHMWPNDYKFNDVLCKIVNQVYGTSINYWRDLDDLLCEQYNEDWQELFYKLNEGCEITFGGYPNFIQSDPRDNQKIKREECIFKLDSASDYSKIKIGDAGIIWTLIAKEDLKKCNFDKAIVDWDCC